MSALTRRVDAAVRALNDILKAEGFELGVEVILIDSGIELAGAHVVPMEETK